MVPGEFGRKPTFVAGQVATWLLGARGLASDIITDRVGVGQYEEGKFAYRLLLPAPDHRALLRSSSYLIEDKPSRALVPES